MMETLLSRENINDKGTFNVHLTGGSPWGFTLHGGREFNSRLCISKITPGGKADKSKGLQVGDEVVAINNMECSARAEAIEQVRCSRQSLNLTIKRENSKQNGFQGRTNNNHPLPNLYKTALEVAVETNDFYKTYSVDPYMYKRIALHSKDGASWTTHVDTELSASNEDLLESYRNQGSIVGSDEALDRNRGAKSSVTNGRISPQDKENQNSGQSLPENLFHKRTYTSPDHIQKVKIRSANISSSSSTFSSPKDDGRQQSRISPAKHSPRRQRLIEPEVHNAGDDWVDRWLRNDKQNITLEENVSVKNVRSKFEEGNEHVEGDKHIDVPNMPAHNKSNFSRSKSFSGRPSYGVVFGTTAVKSKDHSQITAFQAPLPPARYSSSDLLKEKARPGLAAADSWQSSTISLPVDMESSSRLVTTIQEEKQPLEVRLSRKSLGPISMVSSTSSLDTVGSFDRRQGPAPPPRRSASKILSSFRSTRGKRMHPHTASSGTTREAFKSSVRNEIPNHMSSKSWPIDHHGNELQTLPSKDANRQSWHSQEPADKHGQWGNSPVEQPSKTGQTGSKFNSSVVVTSIRTSTSSSTSEDTFSKPKIHRSTFLELQPPVATFEAVRPQSARAGVRPVQEKQPSTQLTQEKPSTQPHQVKPWSLQEEAQSLSNRIEDTQILQRLMKDNEANSEPTSVKTRIQTFEKSSSHPNLLEEPEVSQLRPRSNHPKQRSWDNTYSHSDRKSPKDTKAEASAPERMAASPEKHHHASPEVVAASKHREQVSTVKSNETEAGFVPIKVTSMVKELEKSESPMKLSARISCNIKDETIPKSSSASIAKDEGSPILEEITRTQSTSLQEKEVLMEEMFKRLEDNKESNISSKKLDESNNNFVIHQRRSHKTPVYSVGDDDVFLGLTDDDLLPPPPPPLDFETSHDDLPLPTPPREMLESPLRAEIVSKDRERKFIEVKAVEHTIQKLETPRWGDIPSEKKKLSYSEEKADEEKTVTKKAIAEKSPQRKEKSKEDEPYKYGIEKPFRYEGDMEVLKEKNTRNYELRYENDRESPEDIDFIKTESKPDEDSNLYENEYGSLEKSTDISFETSRSEHGGTTKSPPPPPLVITSTPTSNTQEADDGSSPDNDMAGNTSPFSGSSLSTPSSSRPGSMVSPKLEALDKEKGQLIESMRKKIEDLKTQMNEISDEIEENEKLGEKVATQLEGKTTPSELSKYQRFTGELNKIVLLLLSLTQRMHRYENTLQELDMSEEADRQQRDILLDKIEHVKAQYQEACKIKEVNDKRGEVVSKFLENYLNEDEFADFQYYIDMKTQLALMHAEIKDKVKMGEERLNALTTTSIDWNTLSLCNY
ncbi:protein Shroom3-like isoform X2 [Actinia tenebrosa]|uniref:Protein Shroom3-like isoform X2 n=1 Tax=Actinia tenebrosa TaxID=6105 RepID=A0A6P8HQK3_ACTTE|nr:protein Shroom3-like isoform X2 [Actinia tenebrosa]